jgi:hypothetical protein
MGSIVLRRVQFDRYELRLLRDGFLMFLGVVEGQLGPDAVERLHSVRAQIASRKSRGAANGQDSISISPLIEISMDTDFFCISIDRTLLQKVAHGARNALSLVRLPLDVVDVPVQVRRQFAQDLRAEFARSSPSLDWAAETGILSFSENNASSEFGLVLQIDGIAYDILCAILGHFQHHVASRRPVGSNDDLDSFIRRVADRRACVVDMVQRQIFFNSQSADAGLSMALSRLWLQVQLSPMTAKMVGRAVDITIDETAENEFRAIFGYSANSVADFKLCYDRSIRELGI